MTRNEFEIDLHTRYRAMGLDPNDGQAALERWLFSMSEADRMRCAERATEAAADAEDERQIILSTVD